MVVRRIVSPSLYTGLSTDRKPITHIPEGSRFRELDTGKLFKWGNNNWYELPEGSSSEFPDAFAITNWDEGIDVNNFPDGIKVTKSEVVEVLTEADATGGPPADTLTFSANISAIEIWHNEDTPQEFIVNGITLHIASGGWRSPIGGTPSPVVTIPEIDCIVTRLV